MICLHGSPKSSWVHRTTSTPQDLTFSVIHLYTFSIYLYTFSVNLYTFSVNPFVYFLSNPLIYFLSNPLVCFLSNLLVYFLSNLLVYFLSNLLVYFLWCREPSLCGRGNRSTDLAALRPRPRKTHGDINSIALAFNFLIAYNLFLKYCFMIHFTWAAYWERRSIEHNVHSIVGAKQRTR